MEPLANNQSLSQLPIYATDYLHMRDYRYMLVCFKHNLSSHATDFLIRAYVQEKIRESSCTPSNHLTTNTHTPPPAHHQRNTIHMEQMRIVLYKVRLYFFLAQRNHISRIPKITPREM